MPQAPDRLTMAEGHFPKVIPWTAGYFAGLSGPQGGPADWTDGNGRNQRNHEIPGVGKGLSKKCVFVTGGCTGCIPGLFSMFDIIYHIPGVLGGGKNTQHKLRTPYS